MVFKGDKVLELKPSVDLIVRLAVGHLFTVALLEDYHEVRSLVRIVAAKDLSALLLVQALHLAIVCAQVALGDVVNWKEFGFS